MLGRHNVTLYADELERCIGTIVIKLKSGELGDGERAYLLGAKDALSMLTWCDMPACAEAFAASLERFWREEGREDA